MKLRPILWYFLLSSVATVIALAIGIAFGPGLVSTFVSFKFGEPRVICLGGQGIEFAADWKVELLDRGDGSWPLMFGVLPLPRSIARRDDSQPFLHLTSARGDSFAVTPRPSAFDQAQALLDCQKSVACSIAAVKFGEEHRALVVRFDDGFSAMLLDVPLHIIVHGNGPAAPTVVRLRACT